MAVAGVDIIASDNIVAKKEATLGSRTAIRKACLLGFRTTWVLVQPRRACRAGRILTNDLLGFDNLWLRLRLHAHEGRGQTIGEVRLSLSPYHRPLYEEYAILYSPTRWDFYRGRSVRCRTKNATAANQSIYRWRLLQNHLLGLGAKQNAVDKAKVDLESNGKANVII